MDIILDLLKMLSASLSPTEFVVVLSVIALSSFIVVSYFLKNVRSKSGMWSFLEEPEEEPVELKDVRDAVEQLAADNTRQHEELTISQRAILAAVQEARAEDKERAETIIRYLEELAKLEHFLLTVKNDVSHQIEELQNAVLSYQTTSEQDYARLRSSLETAVQVLSKINLQLDKIDEYVKSAIPEFKMAHRELSKDISNLSRDVALVERSVQSQINTVNAIKLR